MTRETRQIIAMLDEYARNNRVASPYLDSLSERIKRGEHKKFEPWEETA